jgi:hypothetical protein
MSEDIAKRVRDLETAVSVIVQHFNLEGEVEAAKNARRAAAAEKSAEYGKDMAASSRAAHEAMQRRR